MGEKVAIFLLLSRLYVKWSNNMEKEKLYVVRLYDGFDHLWMDVSKPLPKDEARKILMEKTKGGTENTVFDDIDYYAMFPADTRMLYSHENIVEGRI